MGSILLLLLAEVDESTGDELDKPFELRSPPPHLNDKYCTVSFMLALFALVDLESRRKSGKRPSVTASTMHGSSPFISALDIIVFNGVVGLVVVVVVFGVDFTDCL